MKSISVVVPVYYNEQSIPVLFERLKAVEEELREMQVALEVIFVDDGSGDGSLEALMDIKAQRPATRIVKLTRNFGAIRAAKCGFKFVSGDCFLLLSADLQDPPELIPELVRRWLSGAKFVVCERAERTDPWISRLFSHIYYRLVHLLVMKEYPMGGYDTALMDKRFLPYLKDTSKSTSIFLLAYWLGFKPEVVRYRREKRPFGKSRWTFRKKFHAFLDVMLGFSNRPLRLMSGVGLVVAAVSFGYGILAVSVALAGYRPVPGFASLAALISFLLGVVIFMLGLIGEYLARILDELNRRPEVVIDEVY
jgi:polyisoprenyl-phosphate glycosyltransferase